MKWSLFISSFLLACCGFAQKDTIRASQANAKISMQRYLFEPLRDTVVIHNDSDQPLMLKRVQILTDGHDAQMSGSGYMKPGACGYLVLTGEVRNLVQSYTALHILTFISIEDPNLKYALTLKALVDYNN